MRGVAGDLLERGLHVSMPKGYGSAAVVGSRGLSVAALDSDHKGIRAVAALDYLTSEEGDSSTATSGS